MALWNRREGCRLSQGELRGNASVMGVRASSLILNHDLMKQIPMWKTSRQTGHLMYLTKRTLSINGIPWVFGISRRR
jgi:hypothetical protein